ARYPHHEPLALTYAPRAAANWRGPVTGAPLQQLRRSSRDRALHAAEDADRRCRSGCRRRDPCRLGLEDLRPAGISQLCPPLPGRGYESPRELVERSDRIAALKVKRPEPACAGREPLKDHAPS